MKPLKPFLIVAIVSLTLLFGCRKPGQVMPKVQFTSATPYGADSVLLTGMVTSYGTSTIKNTGFAYSNQPSFDISSNQVLLPGTMGKFQKVVMAMGDSTYYFKCFAENQYGYSVSPVFKYTMPPTGPQTAPCSIGHNLVIIDTNFWFNMVYIDTGTTCSTCSSFAILASDSKGFAGIYVEFNARPANGIYYTTDATSLPGAGPFAVYVGVDGSNTTNSYAVNSGQKVYVANVSGVTTISFCYLAYPVSSGTATVSANVSY